MALQLSASQAARALLLVSLGTVSPLAAQTMSPTFTAIYSFPPCTGNPPCNGTAPEGLAIGSGGILYGTTEAGGAYGLGTAFSLTPPANPRGAWTETVLYNFAGGENGGDDGMEPGGLVVGAGGVLYGTTFYGGDASSACYRGPGIPWGCGVLFSLSPPTASGGAWTEAVLFRFQGETPDSSLVMGNHGVLYGTMVPPQCPPPELWWTCNSRGNAGVFSLTPPATAGGTWTETSLYTFPATPGGHSNVVIGSGGLPYVVTYNTVGGPSGQILSLSPPTGGGNQPWTPKVLYNFTSAQPYSLAVGTGGALYGTSASGLSGSSAQTYGSVWSMTPPTAPGSMWTENTLYSFAEASVGTPMIGPTVGNDGTVYGVASTPCGSTYCGTLFSLSPPAAPGSPWAETTLYSFTGGGDGTGPETFVVGSGGVLYGTTQGSGTAGAGSVFSLKLAIPQPSINPGGLVTAASYTAPVSPGSIASAFGDFFVSTPFSATQSPLPSSLSGLSLQFDTNGPAPLFFVSGGQVNLQVPWELAGQSQANLAATLDGLAGTAQTVSLATFAPAIFAINAQGSGQGAILDASNHLVDASNPATPGRTVLQIFCTGLGLVGNPPPTGSPAPLSPLIHTNVTPTVAIGGVAADVSFSGLAPNYVGLYQVNALVPPGLAANNAAPVVISMQGTASNTVTIAVQ